MSDTPALVVLLGIGTPTGDGTGCKEKSGLLTPSQSGPQIVATLDAGTYCTLIADVGHVAAPGVSFNVIIVITQQ